MKGKQTVSSLPLVASPTSIKSFRSMRRNLLLETLLEGLQVAVANIRNTPVIEILVDPMEQVVTLTCHGLFSFARTRCYWPEKQVNEMFASLVNQGCHRVVIEIIKAPSNQRETFG